MTILFSWLCLKKYKRPGFTVKTFDPSTLSSRPAQ